MQKKILLDRLKRFIGAISPKDRIALLYHPDADGLCSALIVAKAIERIKNRKVDLLLNQGHGNISLTEKTIRLLKKKKINKAIIADLCIDQKPEPVKEIEKFAPLLILDHHKLYNDLNSKKTIFIKSQFISDIDGSRYPASKLCFDLFSKIADLDDFAWIASVGIIGDNGLRYWKPFIKQSAEQKGLSLEDLQGFEGLVNGVNSIDAEKLNLLFKEFYFVRNPKELFKSKFFKYREIIDKEIEKLLKQLKQKAELYPEIELVFFPVKSKYSIKSTLSDRLSSSLYPNQTVIVVLDNGKRYFEISARRQDFKVKMNDLLESAVKGLEKANAGGHTPAAGGRILKRDLEKFKERLIAELNKIYLK